MDELLRLAERAAEPFLYPFDPGQRVFHLYLITALALAFLAYNLTPERRGRASLGAFLRHVFPKRIYTHASARVDYVFFVVNRIAFPLLVTPLVLGAAAAAAWTGEALSLAFGPAASAAPAGTAATLAATLLVLVATDGGVFLAHYLQHKVPVLWEFHKVHHSAEVLTPITVYRMHPVDNLLTGTLSGITGGAAYGAFAYVHGAAPGVVTVLGLNAGIFLFYLAGYNLRHSHVWLAYPPALSHLLVSPAQHQIHHSDHPRHFDKNLGFIFAFWDWLAGTLYVPRGKEELTFGLHGGEHREFDGVWRLYVLPLRKVAAMALRAARAWRTAA